MSVQKSPKPEVNLLDLRPVQNVASSTGPDGAVVLEVPKFRGGWTSKWIMPRLSHPYVHLKLDAHGSFFWSACDGAASVREIAQRMSDHFGEELGPTLDRIGKFLRKLDESKFVLIDGKAR